MKTRKFVYRLLFFFLAGSLSLYSCKKESSATSNNNSLTGPKVLQVQNADVQDALADKTEEDIDNKLDELQNNNYAVGIMKSYLSTLTDTVVITVNHPDTTFFPKVVTLTYYNYKDSSAFENITKNGEIIVTINRPDPTHPRLISRVINFNHFAVTTDSTTILVNGIRTVTRQKAAVTFNGIQSVRIAVTDNIIASTNWAVATTGKTDTLKFTRNVNKIRTAVSHFRNVFYRPGVLNHILFRYVASSDSITYTGTVTGINEKGDSYSKTITSPLIVTLYKGSLVVSSGTIAYVAGTDTFTITFEADPAHKHFTLVSITNNLTGKTMSFDRRFGRIFRRWW
jgi:hypothetical protein